MWKILKKSVENLEKSVENLEKSVENLEKSVENLEKKCEKQFQNRPGSLYRPLKQLGENSVIANNAWRLAILLLGSYSSASRIDSLSCSSGS